MGCGWVGARGVESNTLPQQAGNASTKPEVRPGESGSRELAGGRRAESVVLPPGVSPGESESSGLVGGRGVYSDAEADVFWQIYNKFSKTLSAEGKLVGWGPERLQGLMAFLAGEARDVEFLNMDKNEVGDEAAAAVGQGVANLKNLKKIYLFDNKIGDAGATAVGESLSNLTQLQELIIETNQIGGAGATALGRGIANLEKLEKLFLGSNEIGDAGATAVGESLPNLKQLRAFEIERNKIGDTGATALGRGIAHLENLERLMLWGNEIGDAGATALGESLSNLTQLKNFQMAKNQIGDTGGAALGRGIANLAKLETLMLFGNKIGDAGATAVGESLPNLTQLQDFEISENQIGEAGATALGRGIANLEKLEKLILFDNKIGDAGATAVGGSLSNLTQLRYFEMSINQIGDAGATALGRGIANLEKLERLQLFDNKIGNAGAAAVAEALPNLTQLQTLQIDKDPRKVDWEATGFTMSAQTLAAARRVTNVTWDWAPMVPKIPALEVELVKLLRANGLRESASQLRHHGVKTVTSLVELDPEDVPQLGLNVLESKKLLKLLVAQKWGGGADATAGPSTTTSDVVPVQANATQPPVTSGGGQQAQAASKFAGSCRELIMGDSVHSARGLKALVGLDDTEMLSRMLASRWDAVAKEWHSTGDQRDADTFHYIVYGKARDPADIPPFVKEQINRGFYHGGSLAEPDFDFGHDGMTLKDFVAHEDSKLAALSEFEVFALRAYTSGSFPLYNRPLRKGQRPHPLKLTLYYLNEGLRKLRVVEASRDSEGYMAVKELYRGMKDMTVDADKFRRLGGTEMACMSTTADKAVALKYASSTVPLLFRFKTRGNARGVSIKYLSLFPHEEEFLYPPLTLLACDGPPTTEGGVTVFDITPQFS